MWTPCSGCRRRSFVSSRSAPLFISAATFRAMHDAACELQHGSTMNVFPAKVSLQKMYQAWASMGPNWNPLQLVQEKELCELQVSMFSCPCSLYLCCEKAAQELHSQAMVNAGLQKTPFQKICPLPASTRPCGPLQWVQDKVLHELRFSSFVCLCILLLRCLLHHSALFPACHVGA